MSDEPTESLLKDFFRPGAVIEDLPALFPLLRTRGTKGGGFNLQVLGVDGTKGDVAALLH